MLLQLANLALRLRSIHALGRSFISCYPFHLLHSIMMMSDVVIKQEPVNDARLLNVTSANLEVEIKTEHSDEVEQCDHGTFLKCCKQEPVDSVV